MFVERWSRRAISSRPLSQDTVRSLFEAARWAPSAGNSQPWLFVYGDDDTSLANLRPVLNDSNQRWANAAPLLAFAFARKHQNGKPMPTAQFDTGSAWMSLALQANALGLVAHGMAGFHHDKVYEATGVPADDYIAIAGIAVGYPGDESLLPEDLKAREIPSQRKPSAEVALKGRYRAP
ncbi:MAG TPA: nitroreductase family protein [Polyangiales bacterium]|nr:nitroreductase family protein [Polyangiales bacterium]